MSPDSISQHTKICPTCGTRLAENATRCLVCGSELQTTAKLKTKGTIRGSHMPELTLSLPAALGILALFLLIGAGAVFITLQSTGWVVEPTTIPTLTETPTITLTPTETTTPTIGPTWTPLPPVEYTVQAGDVCSGIAALFNVSIQAIVTENNLPSSCLISQGQVLKIPQPTPTGSPVPTASLSGAEATLASCPTDRYTVQANDTLSIISANYNIPMDAIKSWNGQTTDNVYLGQTLIIPLCMRAATPGPTPTPTLPPPYPAPNLLLPPDGAPFTLNNDTVTLQWASIGELRENEAYLITVEDITSGTGRKLVDYARDTSYIIPVSFRPQDNEPHVMRWWVTTVRQTGSDESGNPVWASAGAPSVERDFTWSGAAPVTTPTP